ncbi:hypothetical protein CSW46_07875, partial [Thermus scotoductus]
MEGVVADGVARGSRGLGYLPFPFQEAEAQGLEVEEEVRVAGLGEPARLLLHLAHAEPGPEKASHRQHHMEGPGRGALPKKQA